MKNALAFIACFSVLFAAGEASDTAPAEDTIHFVKVEPPVGSKLKRGETVAFVVEVEYELNTDDRGFIVVSLTDEDRYNLTPSPLPRADVKRGTGSLALTVSLEVPDYASAIEMMAALHKGRQKEGSNWTGVVDWVRFEVTS